MKLVLCRSTTNWNADKEVRTKLRASTRVGHKKHWDVRVSGIWSDLYYFSYADHNPYAVLIWTGDLNELLMTKLADPDNHILEIMDLPEDHSLFVKLKDRNIKKVAYVGWNKMVKELDFSTTKGKLRRLYDYAKNSSHF